jgi:hypothetical protein
MANISNNFLKGKMNKDLDARLLQNGEYRNAINAQVSKSEGANVGALENVLGNTLVQDFNTLTQTTDLKSIGYLTDEINNTVYVFLTNNKFAKYNAANKNFIISYNSLQQTYVVLVQGPFLNFSQLNPIYGVNILEGLLFWTDNRNQPRKINVVSANTLNYYTTEDQISVATYNPYESIELFEIITPAMVTANPELAPAQGDYQTTMFDVTSKFYPNGGSAFSSAIDPLAVDTGFTVPIPLSDATAEGDITAGVRVSYINNDGVMVNTGVTVVTAPTIGVPSFTTSADISAYVSTTTLEFVFDSNPYYENTFTGDSEFLKDKFVRFSYRFQFDDNEYSIFAPFTQPTFIPEQDGYFMYNKDWHDLTAQTTDEQDTYRSTIVDFMENKVTKIGLRIPLPSTKATLQSLHKITSIDILYKESDALAVKVIDTIPIENIVAQTVEPEIFTYNYNSKKPFKTLPSDEIIRVFDKVPVKAFSQEISANRVIYGNFQTKHTPPASIDYSVGVNLKEDNTATITPRTIKSAVGKLEYPSSTLKQNRTYQVGVVLSDRYGRQSTVILSNQDASQTNNSQEFGGSTTYTGYLGSSIDKAEFPGNALRVLFNQPISPVQPNANTGWPGIYNGDDTSADYNPLGWYSYKIVVKQQEQEYYNVYLPGVLAAYPNDKELELGKTSHAVLINDNINKVPRDLTEVGPTQKQFRSSVDLNGRVENEDASPTQPALTNKQFYPKKAGSIVSTIASDDDLFNGENTLTNYIPSQAFYSIDSDPFIARISTTKEFGVINENATRLTLGTSTPDTKVIDVSAVAAYVFGTIDIGDTVTGGTILPGTIITAITGTASITVNKNQTLVASTTLNFHKSVPIVNLQNLAVFETDPVLSELDIFWETSSSGLITDLNTAIIENSSAAATLNGFNTTNFKESIIPGVSTSPPTAGPAIGTATFDLVNAASAHIAYGTGTNQGVLSLVSVFDTQSSPQDRSAEFTFNDPSTGYYTISVTGSASNPYYYYGFPIEARSFRFLFQSVVNGIIETFYEDVTLENLDPVITGCPAGNVTLTGGNGTAFSIAATLYAVNGSSYGANKQTDLTWTLTEAQGNNYFDIAVSTAVDYPTAGNNALKAIITARTLGGDPPNGTYTLKVGAADAGNLEAACTFNVVIAATVCNFVSSSTANPVPDYDFDASGNIQMLDVTYQNCNGATTVDNIAADGGTYCTQALGTSITWALVNPPASIPIVDRTGVFNSNPPNCGSGPTP